MKSKLLLLSIAWILVAGDIRAQANVFNPDDSLINYNNTPLPPDGAIYKWVRTPRSQINFNPEKFKCYYYNGMAFRLRFPNGYNPADATKKYPVILFFHGGGEATPGTDNEYHLINGAAYFENRINAGLFDAFLLFPLSEVIGWENSMSRINNVLDSLQKYCNLDPDRLISMGISIGANAAISYGIQFPERTAVSISSSPALIDGLKQDSSGNIHIPHWIASGGQDVNPSPASTQRFVDNFSRRGGDVRYSYYPELGHNVWDEMWHEPYIIPYWNSAHKANPIVFYKQTEFFSNTTVNARIGITAGFAQYEWQVSNDGNTWTNIPGAASNEIIVTQNGHYRVRFRRTGSAAFSAWSPNPAVITGGTPDQTAPTVPANLQVVSVAANTISLKWDNSTDNVGVTGYQVYIGGVKSYTTTAPEIVTANLTPNTSYTFTVKAIDQAGNASAFTNSVIATTSNATTSNGLNYEYFEGTWSALPDFSSLTPVKTGITPNIDLKIRTAGRDDHFALLWHGYINITTPGDYTFETISDDGSKLYFNTTYFPAANALVNNDGLHAERSVSGTVNIPAAGAYPIAISYLESSGGETMQVYWTGPGIARQPVPNSVFTVNNPSPSDTIPPAAPANLKVISAGTNAIHLDWDNSTDNIGVTGYDIYVGGVKKYTATASELVADNLAPNTLYTFTVKARDFANNASAFSKPDTATTKVSPSGLTYKYYEGVWPSIPDFDTLTPLKTGNTPNVDISVRTPGVSDNFAFLWEGYINITTPGEYIFETVSDDGSKFYFNTLYSPSAIALVNNDGLHASRSVTGTVNIPSPGLYPVSISYLEAINGETMQVYWTGPGIVRQQIPSGAFFPLPPDTTAPTAPGNLTVLYSGRTFVNLDWDNSTDSSGVTGYEIFVNGIKKFSTAVSAITADSLTEGTTFTFGVKARDKAGNLSPFSNLVNATTPSTSIGLNYRYYEGNWALLPNFNSLTPVKAGTSAVIDLSVKNRSDSFGLVWEGYINIPTAGSYTFETVSDEGSKLYFNSFYAHHANALVNNDGIHTATSAKGTINIPVAGQYPIAITFFERSGLESMQVFWSGPNIPRQLIPANAFRFPAQPDTSAPTAPGNLKALYSGRTFVTLDWDNSTDSAGVAGYDVFVNGVKKYSATASAITADSLNPGVAYNFSVKARDLAGNVSAFSDAITVTTPTIARGLNYRYYEGNWTLLPNFNALTPVKTGVSPNIDLTVKNNSDSFGIVWEGYIYISNPGTYTFETVSDEGSRFYFNSFYSPAGSALVDNDGIHAAGGVSATVDIPAAGLYPIAITFFEKAGDESMQVFWSGPRIDRQLIPDSAFMERLLPPRDTLPPSVPANLKSISTGHTFVHLDWDDSSDSAGVAGYDVYVNGTKTYTSATSAIHADSLAANTSYTFTVKSRDIGGNTSAFSAPLTITTFNGGLTYRYYQGNHSVLPNFDLLTPVKTGHSANVDISVRPQGVDDNFAFVWEGSIYIPTPGTYTFETSSDDGSKLYFNTYYSPDSTALVNNDGVHAASPVSGSVNIPAAGIYPIAVTFFEQGSGETMEVYWTGPGIPRQLIPAAAFIRSAPSPVADSIPPSVPANLVVLFASGTFVSLDWSSSTDNTGVIGYDVYVNGVKKYVTTESAVAADNLTPNTTYSFMVKARDKAGNTSGFSAAVTGKTTNPLPGLTYKYYEGQWNVLPDFTSIKPVKKGISPNVDINVRPAGVVDHFGFLWEGFIHIPTAGTYTFETISDDGSKLYFNSVYLHTSTPLVNNDGLHAALSAKGMVNIPAPGAYPIAITFFEQSAGETMQVYWTGPGITRQLIPNTAFMLTSGSPGGSGTLESIHQTMADIIAAGTPPEPDVTSIPLVYPNPFTDGFNVRFDNENASNIISVEIYDLTGRLLFNQYFGRLPAGKTTLKFDLSNKLLVRGIYLVSMRINGILSKPAKLVKRIK